MTQYFSGNETTERESLLDTITVRSPSETPLLRELPHQTIPNRIHEYSIDEPFQSGDNARLMSDPHVNTKLEGADFSYREPFYPIRLRTIAEIQHFGMEMSGSDRPVNMAGTDSTWDYRSGQLFSLLLNSIDHTLMYGQGSPETSGETGGGDERRTQGLIFNSAWTGMERTSGSTLNAINDPYGVRIPASMWSVFYDANHKNMTSDLFYNNIMQPSINAGADWDTSPWIFHNGGRLMGRIARFIIADGAIPLNERNRSADDGMGSDFLNWFRFPNGKVVGFRDNRWLNQTGETYSFDNSDYTPGAPTSPGSQTGKTFYGDQTLIGYEPGSVAIGWYREPAFRKVETNGDYSRLACVAEFALIVRHPLCVAGGANLLS